MIASADYPSPLTARQWRALEVSVEGRGFADAARGDEVASRRLYEWRRQPAFRGALDHTLGDLHGRVQVRLGALVVARRTDA